MGVYWLLSLAISSARLILAGFGFGGFKGFAIGFGMGLEAG